jgi:hypothetical protein
MQLVTKSSEFTVANSKTGLSFGGSEGLNHMSETPPHLQKISLVPGFIS